MARKAQESGRCLVRSGKVEVRYCVALHETCILLDSSCVGILGAENGRRGCACLVPLSAWQLSHGDLSYIIPLHRQHRYQVFI